MKCIPFLSISIVSSLQINRSDLFVPSSSSLLSSLSPTLPLLSQCFEYVIFYLPSSTLSICSFLFPFAHPITLLLLFSVLWSCCISISVMRAILVCHQNLGSALFLFGEWFWWVRSLMGSSLLLSYSSRTCSDELCWTRLVFTRMHDISVLFSGHFYAQSQLNYEV